MLSSATTVQKLYIRLFAAIGSAPIDETPTADSRRQNVLSVIELIDSQSLPSRLADEFTEFFNSKSGLLNQSFDLAGVDGIDAAGLDRLSEVSRSVGESSSSSSNFQ